MTNSIHDSYLSESARHFLDTWEANRVAKRYNLARTKTQMSDKDVLVKSDKTSDGQNDGKISLKEKVLNFGKGLAVPVNTMLASPANFMITLGSVAAFGALIALTGGAAAPVLVGAGLIGGGISVAKGITKQFDAKTDDEAKQAWQNIGSGTFTMGISALGAKTALKETGINVTNETGTLSSSFKCITNLPSKICESFSTIAAKFKKVSPSDTATVNATSSASTGFFGSLKNSIKNFWNNLKNKIYPSAGTNSEVAVQNSTKTTKTQEAEDIIDAEFTEIIPPERQLPPPKPKLLKAPENTENNN